MARPARLLNHPILQAILGAAQVTDPASPFTPETFLDDHLAQSPLPLVLDADSSQTIAMLGALDGRNMVIEGPPGTGKSQTIVNFIAGAIAAGKKVLFVSEKMAALEVVRRRLDTIGIGAACLELHSNRTNKRAVIEELRTTVYARLAAPQSQDAATLLAQAQQRLNAYTAAVNMPIGESGETPCTAYGHALHTEASLQAVDAIPTLALNAASWTAAQTYECRERVRQLQDRLQRCGFPHLHPFFGSRRALLLPVDRDRIAATLRPAIMSATPLSPPSVGSIIRQPTTVTALRVIINW